MTAEVGYAALGIYPSFRGFGRALETGSAPAMVQAGRTSGDRFGDAAGKSAGRSFSSRFKSVAKAGAFAGIAAAAGAGAFLKGAVEEASNLNESLNAVNVTFGKSAKGVQALGRSAAKSLGLSNNEFNQLAVRFAAFSKTIAGDGGDVVSTLDELTTRASDFASVMNLEVNEAAQLFQSGLAGETEPLRRFGLDLSAAAVEAHAFAVGIAEGQGELTEAEKVQGRYSLLMQQTAKVQGDFANTSDQLANRQRILNAQWDDTRARLGTKLLPVVNRFAGVMLDRVIPGIERAAAFVREKFGPAFSAIGDFIARIVPPLRDFGSQVLGAVAKGFRNFRDEIKDNGPFLKVLGDNLARIGDFMLDKVLPAIGAFASVTIPTAGKVLGKFIGMLQATAEATLLIGEYGARAFGILLRAALTTFDGIVSAAAKGMGWIPGLGDKIKGANEAFDRFRNNTLRRLDEIADGARSLRLLLSAPVTLPVNIRTTGAEGAHNLKLLGDSYGGARAMGGPVDPAHYYKVGERGPEYFRPTVPGVIETKPPAGAGVSVHVGTVVAHDYDDFMRQTQRRARASAGGGVNF